MKFHCRTFSAVLGLGLILAIFNLSPATVRAQGTAFIYQGQLNDAGAPANGTNYGIVFYLYDAPTNGNVLGNEGIPSVTVSNGLFTVPLDFGSQFDGHARWLELSVQKNGGSFTTLAPRQPITPTPYAIFANTASNVSGTISAGQLSGAIKTSQLPSVVVTNGASGVNLAGAFTGDANGLTNLSLAGLNSYGGLTQMITTVPFTFSSTLPVGNGPVSVATADVNGDGKADLISANYYDSTLTVLTNNGNGTFTTASTNTAGNGVSSVTTADLNHDGKPDLICANENDDTVTVFTNNGNGTFTLASSNNVGALPYSVTVADVNGDNIPDLIAANSYHLTNTLTVLLGHGDGTFTEDAGSPYAVGNGPLVVAAADVNHDGKVDLISVNENSDTLTVLTNNGNGTFTFSATLPVGQIPSWVATADLNGDGQPDLITANGLDNTLTVLTNDGSGGFVTASTPTVGTGPVFVLATNVDNFGGPDLICANETDGTLTVLTNSGNGNFGFYATLPVGSSPEVIAAADFNGDGRLDLVTANYDDNTLTVLTNSPGAVDFSVRFAGDGSNLTGLNASSLTSGTISDSRLPADALLFPSLLASYGGYLPYEILDPEVALLDFDQTFYGVNTFNNPGNAFTGIFTGDGSGLTNLNVSQLSGTLNAGQLPGDVLFNNTSGVNLNGGFSGDGSGLNNLNAANLNGIISDFNLSGSVAFQQPPDKFIPFSPAQTFGVGQQPRYVTAADVNGDGKMDLISANEIDNSLTVLTNDGSGGFMPSQTIGVGAYPVGVVAADVNGDGKLDLISANNHNNTLTVLTNNGDGYGTFSWSQNVGTGLTPMSVAAADFNGDGKKDLVCANEVGVALSVFTNNGTGQFSLMQTLAAGGDPSAVIAADVNGDGKMDLVCANEVDFSLSVFTNNGSGGFTLAQVAGVTGPVMDVVAADVNGDGQPDLITANYDGYFGPNVSVLTNNNDGSGTFSTSQNFYVGDTHYSVAAADVNGDGSVDVIVPNLGVPGYNGTSTVSVMTNNGSGVFSLAETASVGSVPYGVTTADLNGDGHPDVITANYYDNTVSVLFGNAQITNQVFAGVNVFTNKNNIFAGDGSALQALNASAITSGTLSLAQLPHSVVTNTETGVTLAGTFSGNGSGLTGLSAAQLTGAGALPASVLPATVATVSYVNTATNGFVKNSITNGLATTAAVTAGFVANKNGQATNLTATNLTFSGSLNGVVNAMGNPIYLKGFNDVNHGLGHSGGITNFVAQYPPDGPILWGYGGGALGSMNGGPRLNLVWTPAGVGIGITNPASPLHVVGNVTIAGNLTNMGVIHIGNNTATVGTESLRIVRGEIVGTTGGIDFGTGFTAHRNSAGNYTITFSSAFAGIPVFTATSYGTIVIPTLFINSASSCQIIFYNVSGTATDPAGFDFIAVGP